MQKILLLFLLTSTCFYACKKKQENTIADIKKITGEINNSLPKLTKKQVDDLATRDGTGTITGWFRDNEIRKIYYEHFGDKSRTFTEYYFDDGMLIFVRKMDYVYNKPRSYTEEAALSFGDSVWYDDKKTKLQVSLFYLNNNKLFKWIDGASVGEDMPVNTQEFTDKESALWGEALVLIKELKEEQ